MCVFYDRYRTHNISTQRKVHARTSFINPTLLSPFLGGSAAYFSGKGSADDHFLEDGNSTGWRFIGVNIDSSVLREHYVKLWNIGGFFFVLGIWKK